jgi:hypothetical protein
MKKILTLSAIGALFFMGCNPVNPVQEASEPEAPAKIQDTEQPTRSENQDHPAPLKKAGGSGRARFVGLVA